MCLVFDFKSYRGWNIFLMAIFKEKSQPERGNARRRAPRGGKLLLKATSGELLQLAPSFDELQIRHATLREQMLLREQIIVPNEQVDCMLWDDEQCLTQRLRFEELLGYFLQADLLKKLEPRGQVGVVMMCCDFPPFPLGVLRRLLARGLS